MHSLSTPPRVHWPRLVGGALIAAGVLGILLSLAGMIGVARAYGAAQAALAHELGVLDRALATTADGLTVADTALGDAERTLGTLSATVGGVTVAISETQATLGALEDLTGTTLPEAIGSTRQALASAQETARVADGVLGALSFVGLSYNPEVPLNVAIGRVSASLEGVPSELTKVSTGLITAETSLADLTANLEEASAGIEAISASVDESAGVLEQYQAIVGELRGEVAAVAAAAPTWITWTSVAAFALMVWLALAQVGLLAQGWELLGRAEVEEADEDAGDEP